MLFLVSLRQKVIVCQDFVSHSEETCRPINVFKMIVSECFATQIASKCKLQIVLNVGVGAD